MSNEKEVRVFTTEMELRSDENGKDKIVGYALKFNRWSKDLGGWFKEKIDPRALDEANTDECVLLINHDSNYPVGRNNVNLTLSVDDIGLRFECDPPETSYAKDLMVNMRAGILNKCSFAFTVAEDGDEWDTEKDIYERTIRKIDKLYDVSVVTTPAYDDTEAVLSERCLNHKGKPISTRKRELLDIEMELYRL